MTPPATDDARPTAHWRDTMRPIRFFMFDWRAFIPWPIWIFNITSLRLLLLVIAFTLTFWALERRGWTFDVAMRKLRSWLAGPERPAVSPTRPRRLVDTGSR